MEDNFLNRIGGEHAVNKAVDGFFDRLRSDPLMQLAIESSDIESLRETQKTLLPMMLGQTPDVVFAEVRQTFNRLVHIGFGEEHYGAIIGHLQGALEDSNVALDVIDELLNLVATAHDEAFSVDSYF
ncbi:MAG: globin domain-containing protein [Planctomycetota bacterium]|jgi:truncated hemoglobin YjbI